jgi:hypothetical protein
MGVILLFSMAAGLKSNLLPEEKQFVMNAKKAIQ